MATLSDAQKLAALGWSVVPAPRAGKAPSGSWKAAQEKPADEKQLASSFGGGDHNIFIVCGAVSRLAVLDCDDHVALDYWSKRLGDVLDQTASVSTGKGKHFYFRLAEGEHHRSRSSPGGESGKWDLRADGGGVIAPPSIHPSGRVYRWQHHRGPEALKDAPAALWEAEEPEQAEQPRTMLAHLLAHPPTEGGRNNWLARVAGHYAKQIPFKDAYAETVRQLAPTGLEPDEVEKLIESIWHAEQAKQGRAVPDAAPQGEGGEWRITQPTEESGWLISGDTRILTQVKERDEDGGFSLSLAPWLDCDLRVLGVFDDAGERTYHVEIRTEQGALEADLDSKTIGEARKLVVWLAGFGRSLSSPDGIWPRNMSVTSRLVRYLEAQKAPVQQSVPALGWHDASSAFITHEGLLRADGFHAFEAVRLAPRVRKWAPYRYGLEGQDGEAVRVLKEVLTFHHESVAAVFGAWWAATLLKPQIAARFSQFPIMALEAPSESGKSTGYFPLMLQLAGNALGKSQVTKAALRDYLSAHRNGIVWIDDLDDLSGYGELLRNTTVEGSIVKKALNQSDQIAVQLRGALVVSGEALGLSTQKALADRAVEVEVPSPVGRESLVEPGVSQFQDIVQLMERYPDLSDFAGTLVVKALALADELPAQALRLRVGDGRLFDKLTIMRLGTWILRSLVGRDGSEWIEKQVEAWIAEQLLEHDVADNALTMQLLPEALSRTGWRERPEAPDPARRQVATPCFIQDTREGTYVWFSPQTLAQWWADLHRGRVEVRTASATALAQQAKALGAGGAKGSGRRYFKFAIGSGGQMYWRLPHGLGCKVLERSREEGGKRSEDDDS